MPDGGAAPGLPSPGLAPPSQFETPLAWGCWFPDGGAAPGLPGPGPLAARASAEAAAGFGDPHSVLGQMPAPLGRRALERLGGFRFAARAVPATRRREPH